MQETNPNSRLEAFCDGVFAIALTLLIIDIKIPTTTVVKSTADLWLALKNILPSIFAFILSFIIILITWVNHHAGLKLASKTCPSFIYANGLLLFTVVLLPFPTSLLGEYILTEHATPAVILYTATLSLQAVSWILLGNASLKNKLYKSEAARILVQQNRTYGFYAFFLYAIFTFLAIWFPFEIAIITILTWIFWLVLGIQLKPE